MSWCGLEGNSDFSLATYTPSSKEELEVKLNTLAENGENVSKSHIPGLYHGYVSNVEYKVDPFAPSFKTVTIPLMKDTKDIRVMLQHLDGSEIDNKDFSCTITTDDANLASEQRLAFLAGGDIQPVEHPLRSDSSPRCQNDDNGILAAL